MRNSAGSHVRQGAERPDRKSRKIEVITQALQPFSLSEKNQPGQRDVGRCQRPVDVTQLRLGNLEINRFVVQILEDGS